MTREEKIEYLAKAVMTLSELGDGKTAYALNEIRLEMKSQLELPEDLEEAAEHLASDIAPIYPDISFAARYERIKKSFIAGAKWDRNQMMEKAMEGVVQDDGQFINFGDGRYIDLDPTMGLKPVFELTDGNKVKVIVIPDEK